MTDVRGAVARIEYQESHREFLQTVEPQRAMINMIHVRRALKNGHTADSLFPDGTTVISTTTINDEELAELTWAQERAMVTAFEPDYHVPTDYPVYGPMDAETRVDHARRCATGSLYMAEELPDSVSVLPLIKGTTQVERAACVRAVEELDPDACVFYATQYFTVPGARQFYGIRDQLEAIHEETGGHPVLVIGYMAPRDPVENREQSLRGLPDSVTAAAGLRSWVSRVEPRSSSPAEMRAAYDRLAEGVADAVEAPPVDTHHGGAALRAGTGDD